MPAPPPFATHLPLQTLNTALPLRPATLFLPCLPRLLPQWNTEQGGGAFRRAALGPMLTVVKKMHRPSGISVEILDYTGRVVRGWGRCEGWRCVWVGRWVGLAGWCGERYGTTRGI